MATICQSIAAIAADYDSDGGIIEISGMTASGDVVSILIDDYDGRDYIWPGFSFLPYGGIYYNRLIVCIAVSADDLRDQADAITLGDDYGDDDWTDGCDSCSNFINA